MTPHEHVATPTLPARVTTPLLTLITQQSLDEDYEHVAEQKRAGTRASSPRSGRSTRTLVVVLAFGTLLAVAAVQTAQSADVTSAGRKELITRIETRNANLADVQKQIARVRSSNAAAEAKDAATLQRLQTLQATRTSLETESGFAPLAGSGVRIVVDDAPQGGPEGEVRDDDLALLVNGLWEAGATGIAVNGQRVTPLSSLRNTAEAIRINDVSLSPPYTVLAVGDTRTLQANLAETTSGSQFEALTQQYGMPVTRQNREQVRLPAAPAGMMALHKARSLSSTKPSLNQEYTP